MKNKSISVCRAISHLIFCSILMISTFLLISGTTNTASALEPEKKNLSFAFIKLTDMAPLAIALEKGYFKDEGLTVTLEAQKSWELLLDNVIKGKYDGAHMLAGQPLAASAGFGPQAHIVTPFSMDLNGNGITVSNAVWAEMKKYVPKQSDGKPVHPIKADALKPVLKKFAQEGNNIKLGMVSHVSTHNYELRYWLAAGGIHPGLYSKHNPLGHVSADVNLYVTPPPLMPTMLNVGVNDGYCVGEPWNQQAVHEGIGVPVITDYQIWKNNPEKVFGLTAKFVKENPNTTLAVVKALIRAAIWLDANDNANRKEAAKILSQKEYVGAKEEVIANSMLGHFIFEKGDKRPVKDFNVFFRYYATYPYYSDAIWYLTQMRRWGQIEQSHPDSWYHETAKKIYRPDIYLKAAKMLVDEGKANEADFPWKTDGYKQPQSAFIDGVTYDGRKPNAYLTKLKIGLKGQ